MQTDVFIAIDSHALFAKSKVYVGRALASKGNADLDQYQLWASLALELLGKAALAGKHPSLVVDPTHWPSLFVAAGINITTDVKTISAKTLFERLTHLFPRFDETLQRFCSGISERRNAELHSADLPFKTMRLDAWEERYWHACDTILQGMGSSLEQWLGAADAKAPRMLLKEAANALDAAVKLRVQAAMERFGKLKKAEQTHLAAVADKLVPQDQSDLFTSIHSEIWAHNCPACNCQAFMSGDQTSEEFSEEIDEDAIWEIVDRAFIAEEFRCPSCELALKGTNEILSAGLDELYEDQQQREMDYEPEYGND